MISNEEFVLIWQSATSRKDVAEKTGLSIYVVSARAAKLRKAGVNIKKFPRGRTIVDTVDVEALNKIIG
jgi:biotin operon repressor